MEETLIFILDFGKIPIYTGKCPIYVGGKKAFFFSVSSAMLIVSVPIQYTAKKHHKIPQSPFVYMDIHRASKRTSKSHIGMDRHSNLKAFSGFLICMN